MLPIMNYITWDVSPFIYEGEHFAIGWYGTLWTLGLIGMLVTLLVTFKHDGAPPQLALVTFMVSLVCVIFFGHLFQGLFYEWYYSPNDPWYFMGVDGDYRNHYFEHPLRFFDFAHGGFASHGVILGVFIAGMLVAKWLTSNHWFFVDRIMMGVLWTGVAVRCGNMINNEICGIETTMPWGIQFAESDFILHPTQIYEILSYLLAMGIGWWLYMRKDGGKYNGLISAAMLITIMLLRIMIEFVKQPQMSIEESWPLNMGQWLSIPFAIWAIWWLFRSLELGKQSNIIPTLTLTRSEKRRLKHHR